MADPQHVHLLMQGKKAWNDWRRNNQHVTPNLAGLYIAPTAMQWGEVTGGPIDLRGADLRGAYLNYASLTGAFLHAADLSSTSLVGVKFVGADMRQVNFSHAYLRGANVDGTLFEGSVLFSADFGHVFNLQPGQLDKTHYDDATIFPRGYALPDVGALASTA